MPLKHTNLDEIFEDVNFVPLAKPLSNRPVPRPMTLNQQQLNEFNRIHKTVKKQNLIGSFLSSPLTIIIGFIIYGIFLIINN